MIPFVITGGIATALSFLFKDNQMIHSFMSTLSSYAMLFMWPAVSGGIAFSMAGGSGLAAGCIAGIYANEMNTAFFGAVIGGLVAGGLCRWLGKKMIFKPELTVLKEMILLPVLVSLTTSIILLALIQKPMVALNLYFTDFLSQVSEQNAMLFGLLVGSLMIVDLAGPIGKTAYFFGVSTLNGLAPGETSQIMAAVMAAGMVPPLALALTITLKPKLFSKEDL